MSSTSTTSRGHFRIRRIALVSLLVALAISGLVVGIAPGSPASAAPCEPSRPTPKPTIYLPPGPPIPKPFPTCDTPAPAVSPPPTDAPPESVNPVTGWITDAIAQWFAGVVALTLNPVLEFLGQTVLTTPDPTQDGRVHQLWDAARLAVNVAYVLFILVGGFILMTRESVQSRIGLREITPRLVIGFIAANTSSLVISKAIELSNAVTAAAVGVGVDPAAVSVAVRQMVGNELNGLGFLANLLRIAIIVMALMVVVTFIVRMAAMVLLTVAAPLALACHALPQTEKVAFIWWRTLTACLASQVGQAFCLVVFLRVYLSPAGRTLFGIPTGGTAWVNILVGLCLLWLTVKIPFWARRAAFGGSTGRSRIISIIKTIVIAKTLGALGVGFGGASKVRPSRTAKLAPKTLPSATRRRPATGGPRRRPPHKPAPKPTAATRAPKATSATFSNAPINQVPRSTPTGAASTATFSHAPSAATPPPKPKTPPPTAAFSSAPKPGHPVSTSTTPPRTTTFSNAPGTDQPRRTPPSPPHTSFSDAPKSQAAHPRSGYAARPTFSDQAPLPPKKVVQKPRTPPVRRSPEGGQP
ncbi:hypothetical protein [Fodinicola acaciae]|uniref:hypothetical protein n=1 Tax=Fodinicola acaciae TaxID=2681555 RepID=UPI0013D39665|nr:hypothetical protein [Fodinicola acaciae]